jgi:hypothetical protein
MSKDTFCENSWENPEKKPPLFSNNDWARTDTINVLSWYFQINYEGAIENWTPACLHDLWVFHSVTQLSSWTITLCGQYESHTDFLAIRHWVHRSFPSSESCAEGTYLQRHLRRAPGVYHLNLIIFGGRPNGYSLLKFGTAYAQLTKFECDYFENFRGTKSFSRVQTTL